MKKEIEKLVLEKGFCNKPEDVPKKLLFAFIEGGRSKRCLEKRQKRRRNSRRTNRRNILYP